MDAVAKLKAGYEKFQQGYYQDNKDLFKDLVENGQHPKTLLVSCSDSRVEPGIILQNQPGEVFSIRNAGNFVPPKSKSPEDHGVTSALEYAIKVLKVENIMIMGHAHCGAVKAAIDTEKDKEALGTEFVQHWVEIAHDVFENPCCCADSIKAGNRDPREVEYASVVNSMNNLLTFEYIKEAVDAGQLKIHGLHFDIESGALLSYNSETGAFGPL
ncbi:carbonic anhydrase [Terasakiella sp. SH-1]|uniref:carbonic anhydrase n=1 Tax=Terasakiella sp. SH-1 TaxID=2560057 RepID=UPI0010739CF3|nr:carbonic anhydrase [Terasakiella sp. SH-1]